MENNETNQLPKKEKTSFFRNNYKKRYKNLLIEKEDLENRYALCGKLNDKLNQTLKEYANGEFKTKEELRSHIRTLENNIIAHKTTLENLDAEIKEKQLALSLLDSDIITKKKAIASLDDALFFSEFGLYSPIYKFANSEMYKDRLAMIRLAQKTMIRNNTAILFSSDTSFHDGLTISTAMIKDNIKHMLRSFNNETEVLINKVKFNNVETIRSRIVASYESLNRLNHRFNIMLSPAYLSSKLEELNLSYEYTIKKQEEREIQREERERLREDAKLQQELKEKKKTLKKEKTHYNNALESLSQKLRTNPDDPLLLSKKEALLEELEEINKGLDDINYREANKRAGYVYIVSNIGSFGEGIYKIGMTRRLDPMDRIRELGDASVPFNFDVHAIIFSDDAPKLEKALHHAFEKNKLNRINTRREFFQANLEDIEQIVRQHYDKAVEFIKIPEAQQYRESLKLKETMEKSHNMF